MDTMYIWPILTLILALILIYRKPRTKNYIIESLLLALLMVMVGLSSIWAFMGHAFMGGQIAAYIGWPAGSPFQLEVAVANLSYGILGLLCLKFRDDFWTATIVGFSVFYLGAAYIHIQDMFRGNYAPGNVGAPLYFDIILPILLLGLLAAYKLTKK
ncbi:MAG: hypothetical protein H5T40_02690 [Methanobacteriales archaeon]|uniref:Uncharacterized protein n=2 Tax=Methanothermobacter tenebrarum TaxID=680118 RepID=A0A328PEW9_9EURY|nr:hypothetical protein [Methanobacteriales archaeon]MBC7117983.1 hypothetical protein [Methanobacteriaceae archaeon]RAO79831.1 hypothetical protein DPC56_00695 [Methanothermobacter tenebrarum]BAW30922.1 putative conserved hypothetical protein [Methanothermobacter sp. MT-2]HHW04303.1 hypothetical protein [Methanothermobacter sp.]